MYLFWRAEFANVLGSCFVYLRVGNQ